MSPISPESAGISNRQGTCGRVPSTSPWNITQRMARCETANEQRANLHSLPSPALCPRGVKHRPAKGRFRENGPKSPSPDRLKPVLGHPCSPTGQPHGHSGKRRRGRWGCPRCGPARTPRAVHLPGSSLSPGGASSTTISPVGDPDSISPAIHEPPGYTPSATRCRLMVTHATRPSWGRADSLAPVQAVPCVAPQSPIDSK